MRGRVAMCTAAALAMAISALPAPAALGAGDPVASGDLKLEPSSGFRKQLRRNGVQMKPAVFTIKDGSIDPTTGTGALTLNGKLRFKHKEGKAVYSNLTATVGGAGALQGNLQRPNGKPKRKPTQLFKLSGGAVSRDGFGATISSKAKFLKGVAKELNRELGLHSLGPGRAGSLSVSEQPRTVVVTGGMATIVPNPNLDAGSGTVASKLYAHCIGFLTGVTAISPAVKLPPNSKPTFKFPVTGGTVSPQGTEGVIQQAGGMRMINNAGDDNNPPPGCPASANRSVDQLDLSVNLLARNVPARTIITGAAPPLGGDKGQTVVTTIDSSSATTIADPNNHTVTVSGVVLKLSGGTALSLNLAFMNQSGDGSNEFASGDLLGTASLTLQVR